MAQANAYRLLELEFWVECLGVVWRDSSCSCYRFYNTHLQKNDSKRFAWFETSGGQRGIMRKKYYWLKWKIMELLAEMHAALESCVNKVGDKSESIPREEIDKDLVKFVATAKKLEAYLLSKQNEANSNSSREIKELEKELAHKSFLIEKYTKQFATWEAKFNKMKDAQQMVFDEI